MYICVTCKDTIHLHVANIPVITLTIYYLTYNKCEALHMSMSSSYSLV